MSGVIVERLDQVLITGGRLPPARARSTALRTLSSMYGPFLTERAIYSRFARFGCRVSGCRVSGKPGAWHPILGTFISFFDPSKSFAAFACYFWSYNHASAGPRVLRDYDRLTFFLHHRRADGPQGS